MTRTLGEDWPAWLRDVDAVLAVQPHFVLSGNIRDRYRVPGVNLADSSLPLALQVALAPSGFDTLLLHDLIDGYRVLHCDDDREAAWANVHAATNLDLRSAAGEDLTVLTGVLRGLAAGGKRRLALVLDYASRLTISPGALTPREHAFFTACSKLSHEAQRPDIPGDARPDLYNPVFWLIDREHDLPAWFTAGNRAVRSIPVAWPDLNDRQLVSRELIGPGDAEASVVAEMAGRTEGMSTESLFDIATLLDDQAIPKENADDAVRAYTVGAGESPWRHGSVADRLRRLDSANGSNLLSDRVLGQGRAITKAVDILKRAVLGLAGAQAGRPSAKPRGVLFFAGPTGTGKTELAKAITELVFGSDQACVRFDMSEFSAEHAGDRLVGAPPGYVGFEGGGELTNAVRRRPYCLLLFDEVDKAHQRILDKFLQLLDEGRLTDGRGTTVRFAETLIVFTSNLGMSKPDPVLPKRRIPNVKLLAPYEELESKVTNEIRRFFNEDLNRPELLNRVGDNIVVFDFIRPDTALKIVDIQLANIVARVLDVCDISIEIAPEATAQLRSVATADLTFGGRGIGNVLESRFINPLARALFERNLAPGSGVVVQGLREGEVPEVMLGPRTHPSQ